MKAAVQILGKNQETQYDRPDAGATKQNNPQKVIYSLSLLLSQSKKILICPSKALAIDFCIIYP